MSDDLVIADSSGKEYVLPKGTTKEKAAAYFTKIGVKPAKRISGDYGTAEPKARPYFDPGNPMIGVPSSSIPVAGFGGGMATQQTAKDVQAAAKKGEETLRTGAEVAGGVAGLTALGPLAGGAGAVGTVSGLTGMGAMAGAGAATSVAQHAINYVLGGEKKSLKELGKEVTLDAVLTGATQGVLNVGDAALAAAGKKVVMPLVARTAAMFDRGKAALDGYGVKLLNGIRMVVDSRPAEEAALTNINLKRTLSEFWERVNAQRTGMSKSLEKRWPDLLADMMGTGGNPAALAETKGTVSQFAWNGEGLSFEERDALRWLDNELKQKIRGTMRAIGGKDGQALYDAYLSNRSQRDEFNAGVSLAEQAIKRYGARLTVGLGGAAAGGYLGHREGVLGSAAGATAGAATAMVGAPFILERMIANRSAGPVVKLAINEALRGNMEAAQTQFSKAVAISGVKKIFGPLLKEEQPKEAPDAAPAR